MAMFEELYALATSATLTLVISAEEKTGRMTINVIPKPKADVDEPALTKALSLTATPTEFDAEFVALLKGYREVRQSLAEQAEATREVLQAAKTASARKAGEAVTKAAKSTPTTTSAKPAAKVQASEPTHDEDEPTEAEGNEPQPTTATVATGASFDLFG